MTWQKLRHYSRTKRAQSIFVLAILGAIAFIARDHMHFIGDGWRELKSADLKWILIAAGFSLLSMAAQAEVMVVLLRSAGVNVKRRAVNVLGLAANAWSASFPGGPALSAAMIFREQMKWGATPVIASWYMILSGALAGAGMAILAIGSVFFLGLTVKPLTLALSVLGLLVVAVITNWVATHTQKVETWLIARSRAFNRWRGRPEDRFTQPIESFTNQLSAVELRLSRLTLAIFYSMMNWILEIVCLLACIMAIGGEPPIAGVVLSFLASKLVGQAQITPGGLGPVDVALTTTLVGLAAMTSVHAFAAVLVYRMVNFVGLTLLGWIVYFGAKLARPVLDTTPVREEPQWVQVGVEKKENS